MSGLTASKEHYIKAIYALERDGEGARISNIAASLGVAKASACTAMKELQSKKLIIRDANRLVHLTDKGKAQAILSINKYTIILDFLIEVLNIDKETASQDACAIEHVISMESLCALCRCLYKSKYLDPCKEVVMNPERVCYL